MPFTLAHPALVLPLHSKWRAGFLPLVIGSMGPDLQYFLPRGVGDTWPSGHTASGAITVAAPMALAVLLFCVVFAAIIVAPLWGRPRLLVQQTLQRARHSPANWISLIPALIVGCESHVLWDSFTHASGWGVQQWPMLTTNVAPFGTRPIALFKALQYVCSILGLLVLAVWGQRRLRQVAGATLAASWRPWALAVVGGVALAAGLDATLGLRGRHPSVHDYAWVGLTTAIATFTLLYVLLGAAMTLLATARTRGFAPRS